MEVKLDYDEMRYPFHTIGNENEEFTIKVEEREVISWICESDEEEEKIFIISKLDYQLYFMLEKFIRNNSEGSITYPSEENKMLNLKILDEDRVSITFYKNKNEKNFRIRMDLKEERNFNELFFNLHEKMIATDFKDTQISIDEYQYQLKLKRRK